MDHEWDVGVLINQKRCAGGEEHEVGDAVGGGIGRNGAGIDDAPPGPAFGLETRVVVCRK